MLELTVSIAFFLWLFLLFHFHKKLRYWFLWYFEGTDKGIEDEIAYLNVKCPWKIVPIEFWWIVEEKVADKNNTSKDYDSSKCLASKFFVLISKKIEKPIPDKQKSQRREPPNKQIQVHIAFNIGKEWPWKDMKQSIT